MLASSTARTSFNIPGHARIALVQQHILQWFAEHGRDLPWRHARDPYRVLVSEVMLQQIQVARAIPFYLAFIERFPTVQALAEAPIADVIRVWGDLGRYRRIVFLHRTAREIVERFGGVVPSDVESLRSLPGVGPYTAGAVACFAYERDVGFVDTNVRRVIGRIFFGAEPADGPERRQVEELAAQLVPERRGWDWNQGLLDFGALHCTARNPKCGTCPVAEACYSHPIPANRTPRPKGSAQRFEGSNRYYRGRILAALRDHGATGGVPLSELGSRVKPEFAADDLPWLYGVVSGLERDGLAQVAEERPDYDPNGELESRVVRLP